MAGYPWSELGLDGPADERSIRRAYATRLKIVRPDVDAAGFQRLVQARDVALRMIENTALQSPQRSAVPKREETATPGDAPLPNRSASPPEVKTQAPRVVVDQGEPEKSGQEETRKNTPPAETSAPVEIEIAAGSRSPPAEPQQPPAQQPPVQQQRPVTVDVDPPKPPPTWTEPEAPPARPVADPVSVATGPDVVVKLLSAFVDAWTGNLALPPVAPILKLLGEQSIVERQKLEVEALRAVATVLSQGLFDANTPEARQKAAQSLVLGLDDDYAWTSNDRRLHAMMPQEMADQIALRLRAVREWVRTGVMPGSAPPPAPPPKIPDHSGWMPGLIVFGLLTILKITSSALGPVRSPGPPPTPAPFVIPPGGDRVQSLVQQIPNPAVSFYNRGISYDKAGEFDRAIEEYSQAIRFNPNYALAYYNRGLDYASKGRLPLAIDDYDQAIRLNPSNADNFVSRGAAYDGQGKYDRAIQDYDQALRLKPGYVLAFVNRGIAYANKEWYDRAIMDYDAALRIKPNDPDALYNRGQAKRANGDIAGGDADIAKAGK